MALIVSDKTLYIRVILVVVIIVVVYRLFSIYVVQSKPPKGLKPLPQPASGLLGDHMGQFDPLVPFPTFDKWAEEYGPIFQVKLGSQPLVVVSDPVMTKDLLEKRGGKYSSRNAPYLAAEIMSRGKRIGFTHYGIQHRAFRKQMQSILSISRGPLNRQHQELESRQVLKDMLDLFSGIGWIARVQGNHALVQNVYRRYTASLMSTLAFGHRIPDVNDEGFAKNIFDIMHDMCVVLQPGQYLVDIVPWLKHLPYFLRRWEWPIQRKARSQWNFLSRLLTQAQKQQDSEISNPGLVRALLDQRKSMTPTEQKEAFLDDECIAFQSMTILEAGADTTTIGLMNFTMAMLLNPEVQSKAQKIIDTAIGDSRIPTFGDVQELQYIRQIVKEVLRWRPPLPNAIPHVLVEDDEYRGYYLQKGSMIIGNVWSIHYNPNQYQDPYRFNPDRYDGDTKTAFESSTEADPRNRDHFSFGWGRRICPGLHLADDSLFLLYSRLLWAFDIVPLENPATKQPYRVMADPLKDYDNNIISSPYVFPVRFRLRSEKRGMMIEASHKDAMTIWDSMALDLFKG